MLTVEPRRFPEGTSDEYKLSEVFLNSDKYKQAPSEELLSDLPRVNGVESKYISSYAPWKVCVRCKQTTEATEGRDKSLIQIPDGSGAVQHRDGTSTEEYIYAHVNCPTAKRTGAGEGVLPEPDTLKGEINEEAQSALSVP